MSRDPTLRLVGVQGRLANGRANIDDRDCIVNSLSEFSSINYWDRPDARRMLSANWADDATLIEIALKAVRERGLGKGRFERESAMHYLLSCSPTNTAVVDWVRRELKDKYPFALTHDELWDNLIPFAIEYPDIRASVVAYIRSEQGQHNLHYFQKLIVELRGDELRDALIAYARIERPWFKYWVVKPLLEGWGRSDMVVASLLDEIATWNDERIEDLASILPKILTDFGACRSRLLKLAGRQERPRVDLVAQGFVTLGCTSDDTEVVDALLAAAERSPPAFDASTTLFTHFAANARVRQFAEKALIHREPPLGALAKGYENDSAIRASVLAGANSLPATLRVDIAESAFDGATGREAFKRLLENYDIEADGDLKIVTSIYYHRYLSRISDGVSADHVEKLVLGLNAVGPDLDARRAAAFAGMLLVGHVKDMAPMMEYGDTPLRVRLGTRFSNDNESLMELICERWNDLCEAFGPDVASRSGNFGMDEGDLWDHLAPHIGASPSARRDFLAYCNSTSQSLGLRSLVAFAKEQPSSELLLDHCWRLFVRKVPDRHERHSPRAVKRIRLEIAQDSQRPVWRQSRREAAVARVSRRWSKCSYYSAGAYRPE